MRLGSLWRKWASTTTAHGFPDYTHENQSKIHVVLWTILMLTSYVFLMQNLYAIIIKTINGPHYITSVYYQENNTMQMPELIVCSFTRISARAARSLNFTNDLIQTFLLGIDGEYPFLDLPTEQQLDEYTKWRTDRNLSYLSILENTAISCETLITHLRFSHSALSGNGCESAHYGLLHIEPMFEREFGICYRLHFNITVTEPGVRYGVRLFLNSSVSDQISLPNNNYLNNGFALQVGMFPQYGKWMLASPGYHTMLAITPTVKDIIASSLPVFEAPCQMRQSNPYTLGGHALEQDCHEQCYFTVIQAACGCVPWYKTDNGTTCEVEDMLRCAWPYLRGTLGIHNKSESHSENLAKQQKIDDCRTKCVTPCQYTDWDHMMTFTPMPMRNQLPLIAQEMREDFHTEYNQQEIVQSIGILDVFFEDMTITQVYLHEQYPLDNIISNVGGQLGIWAGISIITIAQFTVYFCSCCRKQDQQVHSEAHPDAEPGIEMKGHMLNETEHKNQGEWKKSSIRKKKPLPE